ncbi:TniQ family protein [Streptomyces tropicalis]|uniref:TniQ family protein n=1 Tax=Streptomyces tropicalis TaxID=3034234 RepID=A0ABT6A916_9ACTN|nr:TniQ family protein [Streptomyces tropicalis]MDF3300907.1 TniQ family protein [Streptomyces tropicalis]
MNNQNPACRKDLRTLPLRSAPLPGEALDSWLETLAHLHQATLGDLETALGLTPRGKNRPAGTPTNWTIALLPDEAAGIAKCTGLPPTRVHAMTLAHYDQRAVAIDKPSRSVIRPRLWGRGRDSRYCPRCLNDSGGRWQLVWRLGWSHACTTHQVLLRDHCPACSRPQRRRAPTSLSIPIPGLCALPATSSPAGPGQPRCAAALTHAPTISLEHVPQLLDAQRQIGALLDGQDPSVDFPAYAGSDATTATVLEDLRAIGLRIFAAPHINELVPWLPADFLQEYTTQLQSELARTPAKTRYGTFAPAPSIVTAIAAAVGADILSAPTIEDVGTRLRPLLHQQSGYLAQVQSPGSGALWGQRTSLTFRAALRYAQSPRYRRVDRMRYRAVTGGRHTPDSQARQHARSRAAYLPELLWAEPSLWLLADSGTHNRWSRRVLSLALLTVGLRINLREVAGLLPDSGIKPNGISRTLRHLESHGADAITALTGLADRIDLHGSPIDYERRRQLFRSTADFVPATEWYRLERELRTQPASLVQAQRWVFETITGSPIETAHSELTLGKPRRENLWGYRAFSLRLLPQEVAFLAEIAGRHLHDHGIDEPVTWQPAVDLAAWQRLNLPGSRHPKVSSEDIPLEWLQVQAPSASRIAKHFGTTQEHIYYALAVRPRDWRTPLHRSRQEISAQAETWVAWYQDEQLSANKIALRAGVDVRAVLRELKARGVTLPVGRRSLLTADTIDEMITRYRRGESLRAVASHAGSSETTVARILRAHGVTLRSRRGTPISG